MVFSHEGPSQKQLWQWGSFFVWMVTISHVILPWCKETPCNHWPSTKRSTFSCEGHLQVWCWQIGECIIYRIDCNCFLMIQLLDCKSPNLRSNHNYRDNCNGLCELHMQLKYSMWDEPQVQPHLKCNCSRSKRSIATCNWKLCRLQVQSKINLIDCDGDDCREVLKVFSYWAWETSQQSTYLLLSEVDRNYWLHIAMRRC